LTATGADKPTVILPFAGKHEILVAKVAKNTLALRRLKRRDAVWGNKKWKKPDFGPLC
jgi:hypothetical protein